MIEDLLPGTAVVVEAFGEEGVREFGDAPLYPQEEALLTRAVAKRRREFTVVRGCARRAMEKLGVPPKPVLPGERGAPQWPDGLTGSMTHC
ncbi:4'-phosphopantetheinyl transferase family protein, partial [Streptomyces hayashii]|uniref:4'-phosphopantetheinyl transferase family protein n=1 Tax=Streptomyces hayashii TaxID=2839966 RepID=UPI00403C17CA